MAILLDTRTGPIIQGDGASAKPLRQGRTGALITADAHGRYFEQASRRNMFHARAVVTAPVIYTTAAGTGGPFLWNSSSTVNAVLLAVGFGLTTASTVAGALGITGAAGQNATPTATTVIDSTGNCYMGAQGSNCTTYRVATPANAGTFLYPIAQIHTGALTVDTAAMQWVDIGGSIIVPPNSWASIAASATLTTLVIQVGLIWEEVPVGN